MRRFYAPDANKSGQFIELDTDETRHLRDVLRLKVGDDVSVFDGAGREFRAEINKVGKKTALLAVIDEIASAAPESPLEVIVAATVLNGERYDLIVQKCVELGVATLIPLITVRCEAKPKDAARRVNRWQRIAMEASKQSGRAYLMRINAPLEFGEVLANSAFDNPVLFSERDGDAFSIIQPVKKITAFYGPKGGWDDSELEAARASGVKIVTLGGRILRAETASIAVTAILQHRFGDVN